MKNYHQEIYKHDEYRKGNFISWMFFFVTLVLGLGIVIFVILTSLEIEKTIEDPTPTLPYTYPIKVNYNTSDYGFFAHWIGTPLEEAIDYCSEASGYFGIPARVFVGLSFAESNFKNFDDFNPWGMMAGGQVLNFKTWHESCNKFAMMMKYTFFENGYDTPEKLVGKYIITDDPANWLAAVKKYWQPIYCDNSLKC